MNLDDQMERCALEYCKRRDFLPFQCTLCHKKFCLEHKDLKDHECPYQFAEGRQCNVLNATKLYNTYQTNQKMRFQSNMQSQSGQILCLNKIQQTKSTICEQVKKEESKCLQCKIKLNEVNKFECRHCHREVCLKHRMQEDHNCRRINQTGCCMEFKQVFYDTIM